MTDYNKFKVPELKELLKERGIPLTGLTRKAQMIEKLEETDNAKEAAPIGEEAVATEEPERVAGLRSYIACFFEIPEVNLQSLVAVQDCRWHDLEKRVCRAIGVELIGAEGMEEVRALREQR